VYEVVHLETERRRALKVMLPHVLQSMELRERFQREAKVAANVDSEFIVDVFDAGFDAETQMPFLVMELLRGEELSKRLKRAGPGLVGAAGVTVGNLAACGWMSDGSAQCWGLNIGGVLGNGGGATADTWGPDAPGTVTGLSGAIFVTMGGAHACAQTEAGSVMCWGQNHGGQIGNGSGVDAYVPVEVPGLVEVTAVAAGGDHTCAVAGGQTIYCWGADFHGEVGDVPADGGTCEDGVAGEVRCLTTPIVVPWTP
jgi:hypothetical protein